MPMPNNWKCDNCLYAEPKNKRNDKDWLLCKRYPPVYNQQKDKSFFPDVHRESGCGEWKDKRVAEVRTR